MHVRLFAMRMLTNTPAADRALVSISRDLERSPTERAAAVEKLGEFGNYDAVRNTAVSDPHYIPKAAAAKAARSLNDATIPIYLLKRDMSATVREAALYSLISALQLKKEIRSY